MRNLMLGLVAVSLALSVGWAQGEAAAPSTVLVVDLVQAVESCDEYVEHVLTLKQEEAEKRKEVAVEVERLKGESDELKTTSLSNRGPEWYEKIRKAADAEAKLKAQATCFTIDLTDRQARKLNDLMRGARQEARRIMRERGAALVLVSKMDEIRLETEQQLQEEVLRRRVLCAAEGVDITEDVRAAMNDWYAKNRKN